MKVLNIAYYTFLRNIRDKGVMLQMLLTPIVLILILGTALSSGFGVRSLEQRTAAFLNMDQGEVTAYLVEFLSQPEVEKVLKVVEVDSYEEGLDLIEKGEASAIIKVSEGFSTSMGDKGSAQIEILADPFDSVGGAVVETVLNSFVQGANTIEALIVMGGNEINYIRGESFIEEVSLDVEGNMPSAMDYYAVTMLVMILMYAANYGMYIIDEDFFKDVGKRIRSSSVKKFEHLSGKIMGIVVTIVLQGAFLVLFSKYVYNVNWGDNILFILLVIFSLAVLSTALGAFICLVTKNPIVGSGVLSTIVPIFTLISGGYIRIVNPGPFLSVVRNIAPNHLAQTAMFNSIYSGPAAQSIIAIGGLWLISIVLVMITAVAGRRQFN